ncbi:Phosphatidylinositol 4-kinase gamma 3 [Raphanus sativus]|uniref:1-phosphatidylinositol 4-kinase n=1 Tax=Raphanus sativus TaxID=3726 RepID=A0A9W3CGG5_RAPSA|nr:phosphatidylinositol 4-kinase gamma 3-like [Raphanus sativus]XP_056850506.1 phosphatidylinositol 4-kinase gamma 3-like [Raphanus sativus]KAJ4877547.1 Phosphatidylinositol 4-kinase gamma 3 [Raphanus sativus]
MSFASVALCPALEEFVNFPRFGLNLDDPILIFLNIAESLNPMRVMESDSLASVKLTIQSIKGFFVKKQKLLYDGRELARDYVLANEKLLRLVIKLSDLQAMTLGGKAIELFLERSRSVGYVKQKLTELGSSALYDGLTLDGEELDDDQRLVTDLCKNGENVIHLLIKNPSKDFFVEPLAVNREIELTSLLKELISSTIEGLEKGNAPMKSSDGSGGAYFMQDQSGHKYVSVFKPIDEEPMAVNNPHGQPLSIDGEGLKKGTQVGEGAFREVAAYILDYPMTGPRTFSSDQPGFSGVPPTAMVKCLHKDFNHPNGYSFSHENAKIGSLQMFVSNVGTCEDMGYGVFPVEQVHKISVLDIRLANADRHGGNILVSRDGNDGQIVLTPIDHGYCFPNKFEDCTFEWLYWPQAKEPYSSETLEYIKTLDAEQDIELLRFHGWEIPSSCARVFRISTMLLKKGAAKGLTPFAIGSIMCRETLEKESVIERIICDAEAIVSPETTEEAFISTVSTIMDRYLDQYSLN